MNTKRKLTVSEIIGIVAFIVCMVTLVVCIICTKVLHLQAFGL